MRLLVFFLLSCLVGRAAGPFSYGVKAGVPLTEFLDTASRVGQQYSTETKRYTVGPMVEVHLPFGLSVEADALYQQFNYNSFNTALTGLLPSTARTTANQFEFPLVAKYRFRRRVLLQPYVEAGASFRHLYNLQQVVSFVRSSGSSDTSTSTPAELTDTNNTGFVFGGGAEVRLLFLRISPEFRFTQWGRDNFRDGVSNLLKTNRSQGEFLVGFTF